MSKKKRLVVNVSEKVSEAIWKMHCDQKISQSRIVERILESNLCVLENKPVVRKTRKAAV
jgi:hypothetical protein